MNIKWNYKIDLADTKVFDSIEEENGIVFPEELKKIIIDGNAATPEKFKFMAGTTERILGAILSFNKGERDTDTVFTALEVIGDKRMLPFAIDPFGNYICLNLENGEVVFWDHETRNIFSTNQNLYEFFESLY